MPQRKPAGCASCPLCTVGQGFVRLTLPQDFSGVRLLLQGEAPGTTEVDEGRAFAGKAGHWIRHNILANAGLSDTRVLFDNTLRCLPPINKKGEFYPVGEVRDEAEKYCRQYDVFNLCPKHIPLLLVGGKSLRQTLGLDNISDYHGHIAIVDGRIVGATFHPAAVMRQPNLLPVAIREISNLMEASRNPRCLDRPAIVKTATLPYREGKECVVDLEWGGNNEISVVGVAYERSTAYSTHNVVEGMDVVRHHLQSGTRIIGHNFIGADLPRLGGSPRTYGPDHIVDTMVVAHLVHAHLAELGLLGLGDLTRFYAPTTDWKQDKADILRYNGYDCAYNFRLWEQLRRDLDITDQWSLVEKQQELAHMTSLMRARGVKLDVAALTTYCTQRGVEKDALKAEFPFNPNAPQQVKDWLSHEHRIAVADATKKTLEKLRGRHPDIDLLLAYRLDNKSPSTWFPIHTDKKTRVLLGIDERAYPHFSVTGTAVARFSCADPNFQNLPPRLRRFIVPDSSELELVAFDGSQIENRCIAYLADDKKMLAAFASGMDFHRVNAANIFSKRIEEITKDERQNGKTTTHATNYLETPYNLAERLYGNRKRDSIAAAKRLQDAYFAAYPATRAWQQRITAQLDSGDILLRNPFGRVRFIYAQDSHERAKRGCHFLGCSTAADIINDAARRIWHSLDLLPLLIVHDELAYQLPRDSEGARLRRDIREIMEQPIAEMNGTVIPVSVKRGPNYGDLVECSDEMARAA